MDYTPTVHVYLSTDLPHTCPRRVRIAARRLAKPPTRIRALLGSVVFFFFNDPATPEFYPLPLHDAFPIYLCRRYGRAECARWCPTRPHRARRDLGSRRGAEAARRGGAGRAEVGRAHV